MSVKDDWDGDSGRLTMKVNLSSLTKSSSPQIAIQCPHCKQMGTFDVLPEVADAHVSPNISLGIRRCPNRECKGQVFFISQGKDIVTTWPPERVEFDTTDIPQNIVKSLEEAITCHASQCYIAASIMVRRSLEEICAHEDATGKDLKHRLESLRKRIVVPKDLFDAMDSLRLLGNDAAHVESRVFDDVGQREVEAALSLTKEILKSVYQYRALVKCLTDLKRDDEKPE